MLPVTEDSKMRQIPTLDEDGAVAEVSLARPSPRKSVHHSSKAPQILTTKLDRQSVRAHTIAWQSVEEL